LKTFRLGGVHPEENKLSAVNPVVTLEIPKRVMIPLGQNLGAPSKALVKKGDMVKTGQLIAKGEAFISANVHSSVSGKVFKIDQVTDTSGYKRDAVIIDVDGDEWEDSIDRSTTLKRDCNLKPAEIIEKLKEYGIVGLGGATFPSHVKLMIPEGKKADVLIINGVECEPYLTSDHELMLEKAEEIFVGTEILMKAVDVKKAVIGIENNKKDAIARFTEISKSYPGIEVQPLKVKYPQGGEKQLIEAITGRQVPSGALPISVGAIVQNVGTTFAVYEEVQKNKPLFERIVTVTGKEVKTHATYEPELELLSKI